jgi:hypothetical protein
MSLSFGGEFQFSKCTLFQKHVKIREIRGLLEKRMDGGGLGCAGAIGNITTPTGRER